MQSVSVSAGAAKSWRLRISPGRLGKAALMSCVLLLSACNVELYDNLDQKQANEIVATLFRQGIAAERVIGKNGKYAVGVEESRFAEAIAVLNEHGLPKHEFATLGDVFKNDGIVASPVQERAQMIYALSQELARTISEIDGVLSSRVHLVLPENDPLRQQLIPSSASVFIRHVSTAQVATLIPQVKMLVANGIAGLTYDKVSVVLVPVNAPEASPAMRAEQELTSVLGIYMHRDSVARAGWMLVGLVALLVGIGGWAAFLTFNQRRRVYTLPANSRARAS
ncbi:MULTISPECIES: type III secretion inner membrane ring lipoprotein SctJ [Rhodomicrobium]|uniref:type III secretion system inner membrane ring lipoprotein SctJ n=1 Tax=Rhodomicrobium TaxID=1068 RepID=UPI001FDA9FA2|nr:MULTISPECIES: type III secretion inner membrane ring lipoprotein SctJ [Rhodomicrobium]